MEKRIIRFGKTNNSSDDSRAKLEIGVYMIDTSEIDQLLAELEKIKDIEFDMIEPDAVMATIEGTYHSVYNTMKELQKEGFSWGH